MTAQFLLIEAERLDRLERALADLAARLDGATVTPAREQCVMAGPRKWRERDEKSDRRTVAGLGVGMGVAL